MGTNSEVLKMKVANVKAMTGTQERDPVIPLFCISAVSIPDKFQGAKIIRVVKISKFLYHQCANKGENRIEFRKCGVDHGICLDIMSLRYSDDTVCADLTLTYG